jgi:hypothetical protein
MQMNHSKYFIYNFPCLISCFNNDKASLVGRKDVNRNGRKCPTLRLVEECEECEEVEGWQEVLASSLLLSTSSRLRPSFSSLSVTLLDLAYKNQPTKNSSIKHESKHRL